MYDNTRNDIKYTYAACHNNNTQQCESDNTIMETDVKVVNYLAFKTIFQTENYQNIYLFTTDTDERYFNQIEIIHSSLCTCKSIQSFIRCFLVIAALGKLHFFLTNEAIMDLNKWKELYNKACLHYILGYIRQFDGLISKCQALVCWHLLHWLFPVYVCYIFSNSGQ